MKKSVLMLVALFVFVACSATSSKGVFDYFLELVAEGSMSIPASPKVGDIFYDFSDDGHKLTVHVLTSITDTGHTSSTYTYTLDESSLDVNASGIYVAKYYTTDSTATHEYVTVTVTGGKKVTVYYGTEVD